METPVLCRFCKHELKQADAKACSECGRYQPPLGFLNVANEFGILIAIVMMILAWLGYVDARQERVLAQQALTNAQSALSLAEATEQRTAQNALSVVKIVCLDRHTQFQAGPGVQEAENQMSSELDALLHRTITNDVERSVWLRKLRELYPEKKNK